jgi:phosphoribosylformimino-5-aminoimidazole carboxamide ribotide isomerase
MTIIPAMDVLDGCIVRLRRGRFDDVREYSTSVAEQFRRFQQAGLTWVHVVDLTSARGHESQWTLLSAAAHEVQLRLQLGGGIRSIPAAMQCLETLADRIVVGTAAIEDPEFLPELAAMDVQDRVVIAVDMEEGRIKTHGWQSTSDMSWQTFIARSLDLGFHRFLCTDIARDGMLSGSNIALYRKMTERFSKTRLIASGGVCGIDDFHRLAEAGVDAVVVGKAYYDGKISLEQISEWNRCSLSV